MPLQRLAKLFGVCVLRILAELIKVIIPMKKIKVILVFLILSALSLQGANAQEAGELVLDKGFAFHIAGASHFAMASEELTVELLTNEGTGVWKVSFENQRGFRQTDTLKANFMGPIDPFASATTIKLCLQQKNVNGDNIGDNICQNQPLPNGWLSQPSNDINYTRQEITNVPPEIAYAEHSTEIQPGDLAEYSYSAQQLEGGDVVAIDTANRDRIVKAEQPYDTKVAGIISTNPTVILNKLGVKNLPGNFFAVAGWGKVPAKVSNINGPISIGDHITASKIPGYGMKATQSGMTAGKALEAFDESQAKVCPDNPQYKCGKILVLADVNWYEPLYSLSETGDLVILEATYSGFLATDTKAVVDENGFRLVNQTSNEEIDRVGTFAETISAKIRAGFIKTVNLVADSVTVNRKLTAPAIEVTELTADGAVFTKVNTDSIVPRTKDGNITIDLGGSNLASESGFGMLLVKGDAEFEGNVGIGATLETQDLEVKNKLIADSARIKKLSVESIEGLEAMFATLSAQYINSNISGLEDQISTTSSELSLTDETATDSGYLLSLIDTTGATGSASLTDAANTWAITDPSNDIEIESNVTIYGTTTLAQTIVAGPLTQDSTFLIDNGDSINVLGGTLYIQNHRMGGIDLLAGKVTIDVEGNAVFEGDLTVKGTLFANMIKPVNGDLVFDLSSPTASSSPEPNTYHPSPNTGFGKILVMGTDGEPVYSLDASGSAEFAGEVLASSFSINRPVIAAEPDFSGTIVSTASAGIATIPAGKKEVTINSPYVNEKSLIYLTPIGSTANQVIYLARTNPEEQTFTAAIDQKLTRDVLFSWWIVN